MALNNDFKKILYQLQLCNFGKKNLHLYHSYPCLVHLRIFWPFSHDPFSMNHAKIVKTSKFIVG